MQEKIYEFTESGLLRIMSGAKRQRYLFRQKFMRKERFYAERKNIFEKIINDLLIYVIKYKLCEMVLQNNYQLIF
jgi:hypothetical protein